jgi:hypothetical protein
MLVEDYVMDQFSGQKLGKTVASGPPFHNTDNQIPT